MITYSTIAPLRRDDDSRYSYCSRVWARAQRMLLCLVLAVPCATLLAANPQPVDLGTATDFGALSGGAISGTGHVEADIGSGTGAIAPAITSSGTIYPTGDAVVMTALDDFATAFNEGKNRAHDVLLSAAAYELGGKTLTPGVYEIGAAATLTSPLTLNAQGNPDAVFIIKIGGALGATASVGNVILTNDAQSANIFWIVEGAVTMGANTRMEGTILGGADITFGASTSISGRVIAGTPAGTITLATTISIPVEPSVVGDRVWFDSNGDGIQDPSETTGFSNLPVSLMQLSTEDLTIDLGTAADFGALAGGAISGTGHVVEDVGSGTGAIAPAITSDGTIYPTGHADVMNALNDFSAAYNDGRNRTYDVLLSAAAYELGGSTLTPGVYKIGAAATVATPMTLDAQGDPQAVFIIQIAGALGTTASTGNIVLTNDAQSTNVFWIVEGAVSLGASTHMEGNLLGGAAITFGATTTISGRVMAGTAAGTIALADTTISAATGIPPVGTPPPVVVATTLTDASGQYQFGNVQPGFYFVRWDLAMLSSDYAITTPGLGGDEALDSDGVTGNVGGFVDTSAIEVLNGSTNLTIDLGLIETLPAIQAVALDELDTALASYLLDNYYTAENWTALITAKTDGDTAINAATDPTAVESAKDAALAAMAAVPTYAESLAAAKVPALGELSSALTNYLESDYTAENWTSLNTAKTDGDTAINAATDLTDVTTAKDSALAAMDAVPTIAETLAAAKDAALDELTTALANLVDENYYTEENWTTLKDAKTAGDAAINAATDPAAVTTEKDSALAAMDAVTTVPPAPMITDITRTSAGQVTVELSTTPNFLLTIQTSTNLSGWTTIATATPGTELWSFVHEAEQATGPRRFYRAFLTP